MVQASVLDVDNPQGGDVYGLGHGLTHKDHTRLGNTGSLRRSRRIDGQDEEHWVKATNRLVQHARLNASDLRPQRNNCRCQRADARTRYDSSLLKSIGLV